MKAKTIDIFIYSILLLAIFFAGKLVFNEFINEGTCPKLGVIPACYIILVCLVVPFISHQLIKNQVVFFVFISFALMLASYASIGQFFNKIQCPKTENGFPMCYISFGIFVSIFILKLLSIKIVKNIK